MNGAQAPCAVESAKGRPAGAAQPGGEPEGARSVAPANRAALPRRAACVGLALCLWACATNPVEEARQKESAETQVSLASAYLEQRDSRQALQAAQKAIELDPKNVDAYLLLGQIHHQDRRWDQALEAYQHALALDPKRPEIHYLIGAVRYEKRDVAGAIESLRAAIAQPSYLNPEDAHLALGRIFLDQGQVDQAIAEFRKALDVQPEFGLAHNALGYALLVKGEPREAVESLNRAVRFAPSLPEAYQNLGLAYLRLGKQEEAKESFRKLAELAPANSAMAAWVKKALADLEGGGAAPAAAGPAPGDVPAAPPRPGTR